MKQITRTFIPWWIWIVIAIEVSVPTYFGIATIFDPSIWGEDHFGAIGQLYVTRNFTMVLALVVALILRSRVALFVALLARYLTDFVDITAGFIRGPDPETFQVLAVFGGVLLVLPLVALIWLFRHRSAG
ncbi:MAG: hypothetical protein AAGH90_04560 [Pseudomonadota bacterium]